MALQFQIHTTKVGPCIELSGTLASPSDLAKVTWNPAPVVTFDLRHLNELTADGIVAWEIWLSQRRPEQTIIFSHCSLVFIDRANQDRKVLPLGCTISSFYAPYFCESCGASAVMLFERDQHFHILANHSVRLTPPAPPACPACRDTMRLDSEKDEAYFQFLKHS